MYKQTTSNYPHKTQNVHKTANQVTKPSKLVFKSFLMDTFILSKLTPSNELPDLCSFTKKKKNVHCYNKRFKERRRKTKRISAIKTQIQEV